MLRPECVVGEGVADRRSIVGGGKRDLRVGAEEACSGEDEGRVTVQHAFERPRWADFVFGSGCSGRKV